MVLSCHIVYSSTRRDILWLPSNSASAKVTWAVYFARVSFPSYHNPSFTNVSSINTQNLYSSLSMLVCMLHNNYAWSHLEPAFTGDLTSPSHASAIKDSLNQFTQERSSENGPASVMVTVKAPVQPVSSDTADHMSLLQTVRALETLLD